MRQVSQREHWNGAAGQKWVDYSDLLDALLAPLSQKLLDNAVVQEGEKILDVGCGAGELTLAATQLSGNQIGSTGIDISMPLIEAAKLRARALNSPVQFELVDAAAYAAPHKFDLAISRLGVMFFDEPIRAFANIRRQVKAGGGFSFVSWQPVRANQWLMEPLQAVLHLLKEKPGASDPTAPGPFSLSQIDHIATLLSRSGWQNASIEPLETRLTLPGKTLEESARLMIELGPIARFINSQNLALDPIIEAVSETLARHRANDGSISMRSACWLVSASTI
nr:class I SAM-dependent methyltransferase [Hyphomonas sp. Mor2]